MFALFFALAAASLSARPHAEEAAAPSDWSAVVRPAGSPGAPASADFGVLRAMLDRDDRIATLEALQFALDEVGDGATYVWHRKSGPLRGAVKPTVSFRDPKGQVCRHILVSLSLGTETRQVEGVACRSLDRRWSLEG